MPGLAVTALKLREEQQAADCARSGTAWIDTGLPVPDAIGRRRPRPITDGLSHGRTTVNDLPHDHRN